MTRPVLVATDLDRTLIYSRGALAEHGDDPAGLVAVERRDGVDVSWLTADAAHAFGSLHETALVVPVTTRTPDQWRRVTLPGPPTRYVVAANGGVLLVDGSPDDRWQRTVAATLGRGAPLAEVWNYAARVCRPEWTVQLRNADDLFCFAVLRRDRLPAGFLAETAAWAADRGWQLSLQGRKLYWVPEALAKSTAVAEVALRVGATTLLAAGDSLLDADLLAAADRGIVARHGELVASGWSAPHVGVTAASGVLAGEEIVRWLAAEAARP